MYKISIPATKGRLISISRYSSNNTPLYAHIGIFALEILSSEKNIDLYYIRIVLHNRCYNILFQAIYCIFYIALNLSSIYKYQDIVKIYGNTFIFMPDLLRFFTYFL
ncbi:hypothetical protein GCM10011323_16020 [Pontibacter amylolyticus]|uniref:Uncharacterized protein n=1 Tax=Pontibacter amylolyticus TaxID=1424080 RepID=A0ABQ1W2Y8_9BACT|nr:hypothetical protein GCM10011323_16020 [Pontibacter amylolyticus]